MTVYLKSSAKIAGVTAEPTGTGVKVTFFNLLKDVGRLHRTKLGFVSVPRY